MSGGYFAYRHEQEGWQVLHDNGISKLKVDSGVAAYNLCNYLNGGTGMGIREQFASAAMQRLLDIAETSEQFDPDKIADQAFKYADAMCLRRKGKAT